MCPIHSAGRHAFFDLDRTLTHQFTMHHFCQMLHQNQVISDQFKKQEQALSRQYQSGQITYRQAGETANQIFANSIKGLSPDDLAPHLDRFVHLPQLFKPWVKPVLQFLTRRQFQTHLISGSSLPIVSAIAHHLEFDSFAASIPEIKQNQYTGRVASVIDFELKLAVITAILDSSSNIQLTVGFGDSGGDIEMLSHTDLAFVIDPYHPIIIQTAKQHSWHITSDADRITRTITRHLT